jgi:hypothetical protein
MGRRVGDGGASEGHFVMKWIAVEPQGNMTARESGLTSIWSSRTREFGKLAQEAEQMTAELSRPAGAVSRG